MGRLLTDDDVREKHQEHEAYEEQVMQEAMFVGVSFLPVWFLIQSATSFVNIRWQHKDKLDVALSGFVYHLIAENVGINEFYARHGGAVKKLLSNTLEGVSDGSVVVSDISWLCDDYPNRNC